MKEAFKKAAKDHLGSLMSNKIEESIVRIDWNKAEVEKGRLIRELGDHLYELGAKWYGSRVDPHGSGGIRGAIIEDLRIEWDSLKDHVLAQRRGERMELLARLSEGMWLSEEHQSVGYYLMIYRITTPDDQFTSAAKLFIAGISDLSNYSEQETRELRVFVSDRVKGQVGLPLTFNAVAEWMEQKSANRTEAAV